MRDIVGLAQHKLEPRHILFVLDPACQRRQGVQRQAMPRFGHINVELAHIMLLHLEQRLLVRVVGGFAEEESDNKLCKERWN